MYEITKAKEADEEATVKIDIPLELTVLPERSLINLHTELGTGEHPEAGKIRFCQHINGACFWVCTENMGTYRLKTEDLIGQILSAILEAKP